MAVAKKRLNYVKLKLDVGLFRTDEPIARLAVATRHGEQTAARRRSFNERVTELYQTHNEDARGSPRVAAGAVAVLSSERWHDDGHPAHNTEENPSLVEVK